MSETSARVLGPHDGDVMGAAEAVTDSFMVGGRGIGRWLCARRAQPRAACPRGTAASPQPRGRVQLEIAGRHGCDVDFERTLPIVERHGLAF